MGIRVELVFVQDEDGAVVMARCWLIVAAMAREGRSRSAHG
jgi:hypothetical protein